MFSCKLKVQLSETTIRSICDGYQEELKRRRNSGNDTPLCKFPALQCGRPLILGEASLDHQLKAYNEKIRKAGGVIESKVEMVAAHGLLLAYNKSKMVDFGQHLVLNYHGGYMYEFSCQMNLV